MVDEDSPDWLPSGWTAEVKVENDRKVECYSNLETGQRFYSKNDVVRYINMGNVQSSPLINKRNKKSSEKKPMQHAAKTHKVPLWLPDGWIMELNSRSNGTKFKCYIEPVTRSKFYSKPAVTQYLQTSNRKSRKSSEKKISIDANSNDSLDKTVECESSFIPNVSQDIETSSGKPCTRGKKNVTAEKPSPGKDSLAKTIECESSSMPNVSQDIEISKGKPCTSGKKNVTIKMPSPGKVVFQRVETPNELPKGWIKELKIQRKNNTIRKDPYFTDPASGYVFRSKPDALRYLETGDIHKCAIKPRRRDVNNLEVVNDEIHSQSSDDKEKTTHNTEDIQKTKHNTPKKRLFTGKEKPDGSSKKTRSGKISADAVIGSTLADDVIASKLANESVENKQLIDSVTENSHLSTPEAENIEKLSNKKIKTESRKRKDNKAITPPTRSSKRLSGVKPKLEEGVGSSERNFLAAARKPRASEAIGTALNDVGGDSIATKLEADTKTEAENNETPSDIEQSNQTLKLLEDHTGPVELPPMSQGMEEQKDYENVEASFFSESEPPWSDPCLEFAFKTLKGEIPIDDNLSIQDYFQLDDDTSPAQKNGHSPPQEPNRTPSPMSVSPGNAKIASSRGIKDEQPSFKGK